MSRFFALLLRLFPPDFRARFGPEMVEQAREECARAAERGRWAHLACLVGTGLDLVRAGLTEWWSPSWRGGAGESTQEGGVGMTLGEWIKDARLAARSLLKAPGFTVTAVGALALALGANAAIFAVVDAVLLKPLPYETPDRLVHIAASAPGSDFPDVFGVGAEFYVEYRDEATQLQDVAIFDSFTATARAGDRVERLRMSRPTPSLFQTLGATPILGRLPREGESGQVVLLSHALWTTWFGQDPGVIGRSYEFLDQPREVIGVMGPDFRFPKYEGEVLAWIPLERRAADITPGRFNRNLVGRLAPGADHESLARELSAIASRLPELYGGSPAYARLIEQHVPVVRSLEEWTTGSVSGKLWVLMGAVLVVLVIACANVANLFMVRAAARGRDAAIRRAMGASRRALIRAQLAEALVVGLVAGAGALALASLLLPILVAAAPPNVPRLDEAGLSASTLAFTGGASVLAALLCGLAPAVRAALSDLARLGQGGRGSTARRTWGRKALVVSQTALTLVLLVGAGLLFRSFQVLHRTDPGYDTEGILTFQFAPDQSHLVDGPSWARFHQDAMDRLRVLPGVESVGIVNSVPLDEGLSAVPFVTEGSTIVDPDEGPRASVTFAGGDYFRAMGIDVLRGRGFVEEDVVVPGRVVISESAARMLWPGQDPVGRRLTSPTIDGWHTVVGVVEDVLQDDLRDEPEPMVYYAMVGPTPDAWWLSSPGYVVRGSGVEGLVPRIRDLVREMAPEAPMYRIHTMEELVSRSIVQLSFTLLTLGLAAGLALTLGAMGLYGVLSTLVTERSREIGVRMALGAEAGRVRRMVVAQGLRVVVPGIVLGLGGAVLATRALGSLLFGVEPLDPVVFAGTVAALTAVGVLASWLPALRASRVDPVEPMRGG